MGGGRTEQRHVCGDCGDPSRPAQMRGVAFPLEVMRCDPCWNRVANEMADLDGATALPRPDPGPESFEPIEPDECPKCGMEVRTVLTNYERWVHLATRSMRAKEVPRRYWWRIEPTRPGGTTYVVGSIAVRVGGIDPLPDDLVMPAHTVVCADLDAIGEVRRARLADVERQYRLPPSVEEFEDE
ncbi:DUF6083 domain-containing protein [Actinacidiphila yanglinensis]|nr:DUF6083 domain-containing protein [Actinacidiphila yanglinensis]